MRIYHSILLQYTCLRSWLTGKPWKKKRRQVIRMKPEDYSKLITLAKPVIESLIANPDFPPPPALALQHMREAVKDLESSLEEWNNTLTPVRRLSLIKRIQGVLKMPF